VGWQRPGTRRDRPAFPGPWSSALARKSRWTRRRSPVATFSSRAHRQRP